MGEKEKREEKRGRTRQERGAEDASAFFLFVLLARVKAFVRVSVGMRGGARVSLRNTSRHASWVQGYRRERGEREEEKERGDRRKKRGEVR